MINIKRMSYQSEGDYVGIVENGTLIVYKYPEEKIEFLSDKTMVKGMDDLKRFVDNYPRLKEMIAQSFEEAFGDKDKECNMK